MTALFAASLALGYGWSTPGGARAYSDPMSFALPPLAAGGGGRFFTGSPADGYTCKVCHSDGASPQLDIVGLPFGDYQLSGRYEVVIRWPASVDKFAAALEFTDERGRRAGSVRLPPDDEVQPQEYCEPASDRILAASISEAPNQRQVINLPDCGSRQLRFLWTAPSTDVGDVWFAGSAIASDGQSDMAHDGVTDFSRNLGPGPSALTTGGCNVSRGAPQSHGLALEPWWFACIGVWICARRARKR